MQKAAAQRAGLWGVDYEGMRQLAVRRAQVPQGCSTGTIKKFIRKIVIRIASGLYGIIEQRTRNLGLYTYELRHGSKAAAVFLGEAKLSNAEILWKNGRAW